jgi:hypothetical protein
MNKDNALSDFMQRIEHYKQTYDSLEEDREAHFSFIKIFNAGEKVLVHRHEGHIQSRVVYYLMNTHIVPRSIYLTRHGESEYNLQGRIGGDSQLSGRGRQYSRLLAQYISKQRIPRLRVWTSQFKRTIQTAEGIQAPQERWKALNEIDAGICEEMTYEEIQEAFPEEFALRDQDKFHYRYPKGEVRSFYVKTQVPFSLTFQSVSNSPTKTWSLDLNRSLWNWNGRRTCWWLRIRLSFAACLRTFWTRMPVSAFLSFFLCHSLSLTARLELVCNVTLRFAPINRFFFPHVFRFEITKSAPFSFRCATSH